MCFATEYLIAASGRGGPPELNPLLLQQNVNVHQSHEFPAPAALHKNRSRVATADRRAAAVRKLCSGTLASHPFAKNTKEWGTLILYVI